MGAAFVISVVPARLLLIGVLLLTACSPQAGASPSPSAKISASPSSTPQPTSTTSDGRALSLSAIQRLNTNVGYIAGWTGTGLGLAKTSDGGATWQRVRIPADHLTALRFIDDHVGWAAGFLSRDVAQIACQQAAPAGAQPCKGVVLRTQDGGQTWQTVLAIPTNGVYGEPIRQIQAVDGLRAWTVSIDQAACQIPCLSYLQRTTDGGRTWTTLLHANIAAIRFASASRGWVALSDTPSPGSSEVRETSDGGTTWQVRLQTATGTVSGLDAATTSTAWLLTLNTAWCSASDCQKYELFRTDNGGLTWSDLGNPKDFTANCSGGNLTGPLFASTARGWLGLNLGAGGANVGPGGILKSEDGGRTWRCATTPRNMNVVSAADPLHVWAAGEDRLTLSTALYTSEDAGATWTALDLSSLR
jgi:photosystem II stability/assembly factor-like uncharacterized protein